MSDASVIIAARDHDLRGTLRVQLEAVGFVCCVAVDAREAIQHAAERTPRLVMLDAGLPRLGGYEACAAIRRLPECRTVPVVLVTMADRPQIHAAAKRAGASLLLVRPFSVNDLLRRVAPLVAGAAPWQAIDGGRLRPVSGMAESPRHIWSAPAAPAPSRIEASPLAGGRQMLEVMRRREAKRVGP
jgi:DNA-binding response OmpR family regulator